MPDLPLPRTAGELLAAILSRASGLTVRISSAVLPGAVRVVSGAAGAARTVAGEASRRLGRDGEPVPASAEPGGDGDGDGDGEAIVDVAEPEVVEPEATEPEVVAPAVVEAEEPEEPDDVGSGFATGAEDEQVVPVWPEGVVTPAEAHAVAEEELEAAREAGAVPDAPLTPDDLPVRPWDSLTVAAVRQRIRRLDADDVALLLAYERDHAGRPAVLLALERRLARLAEDQPADAPS